MKKFDSGLYVGGYVLSFIIAFIFLGAYFDDGGSLDGFMELKISIILFFVGILFIVLGNVKQRKIDAENKKRINALKSLYQSTKNPMLLGNTYLRTRQAQTRQILTGALTYAQPKEYSLHINCTNISDKTVTAVEIEVKTLNAFNEQVSSFVVSTRKQLTFGNLTECSWDLSGSFDINNATTKVKRVMFSDGTTWNNN